MVSLLGIRRHLKAPRPRALRNKTQSSKVLCPLLEWPKAVSCAGQENMFRGQTAEKEVLWLALPLSLGIYTGTVLVALWVVGELRIKVCGTLLRRSFSRDPASEGRTVHRMLRHSNRFAGPASLVFVFLLVFYIVLEARRGQYECRMWSKRLKYCVFVCVG